MTSRSSGNDAEDHWEAGQSSRTGTGVVGDEPTVPAGGDHGSDEPGHVAGSSQPDRKRRKPMPLWQEVIVLLITALALAIVVKSFFVQAFYVPSGSMEHTLDVNDRILVQKVSYWHGSVQRGDVVVFSDPGGWLTADEDRQPHNVVQKALELVGLFPTGGHLVKRVIAVGGDKVRCCNVKGEVLVNGVPLHETYLNVAHGRPASTHFATQTVPANDLWVMGDNRYDSSDSRAHLGTPGGPFVPVKDVVGKVWAIVLPTHRSQFLHRPSTFDNPALLKSGS